MRCWECRYNTLITPPPNICLKGHTYHWWSEKLGEFLRETEGRVKNIDGPKAFADGRLSRSCPDFAEEKK